MSRRRIYPEVNGCWVYCFITPDNKFYIGQSSQDECHDRWHVTNYIDGSFRPYILKHGWNNIQKKVLADGLTHDQAVILEGLLIKAAKEGGFAINENDSGYVTRDMKKYEARRREKPERQAYLKNWADEHREELNEYRREWRDKNKEVINEKRRERGKKPENLVYARVYDYNRTHPMHETASEAKRKFLATGYVPSYINQKGITY